MGHCCVFLLCFTVIASDFVFTLNVAVKIASLSVRERKAQFYGPINLDVFSIKAVER